MDIRFARFAVCWMATFLVASTTVVLPRSASADMISSYTTGSPNFAVFAPITVTLSPTQFLATAGTSDSDQGGVEVYSPDGSTQDYVTQTDGNQNSSGLMSLLVNLSGTNTLSSVPNNPDFTITGAIWDPSFSYIWDSGTLLTGNVRAYEVEEDENVIHYDFLVEPTGGVLQSAFGNYVELQLTDLNQGQGSMDWKMDVYTATPVPEPSTVAYAAFFIPLGLLMFIRSRRRRGLDAGARIAAARLA